MFWCKIYIKNLCSHKLFCKEIYANAIGANKIKGEKYEEFLVYVYEPKIKNSERMYLTAKFF